MSTKLVIEGVGQFDAESVDIQAEDGTVDSYLVIGFSDGALSGKRMMIGNFQFPDDVKSEDGYADVTFSVDFESATPEENNELIAENIETIRAIATHLITEAVKNAQEYIDKNNPEK